MGRWEEVMCFIPHGERDGLRLLSRYLREGTATPWRTVVLARPFRSGWCSSKGCAGTVAVGGSELSGGSTAALLKGWSLVEPTTGEAMLSLP